MPPPQQAGEKVLSSGWLNKKARTNAFSSGKNWNRRYFVLVAPPPGARRGAFPTLRYCNSDAPASVSQPRGGVAVGPNAAVRVLDTEESLAEFDLPPKLLGKRLFAFQAKPGAPDAATAKSTYVLEAESSAALQHWVAALTEAISKARHSGSMSGANGAGVTSNAAVAYVTEGGAGDGSLAGGADAAPRRAFSGALERAGLVGPLGGPAIANLPGAVWETPAFIDLMADAMLTREAVERRRVALAAGGADGALRPLVRSATDVGRALGQLAMPTSSRRPRRWGTRGRRWWASGTSRWRAPRARGTTRGSSFGSRRWWTACGTRPSGARCSCPADGARARAGTRSCTPCGGTTGTTRSR
jgi:hypothetical protein